MSFSLVDLSILIIALLFGIKGYFSGWRREVATILGLVGGVAIATRLAPFLTRSIQYSTSLSINAAVVQLLLFILILIIIWGSITFLQRYIERNYPASPFGFGGWILASIKYLLLIGIALAIISRTPSLYQRAKKYLDHSLLSTPLITVGSFIVQFPTYPALPSKNSADTSQQPSK